MKARIKQKILTNMYNPKMHYSINQVLFAIKGLFFRPIEMSNGCCYYISHRCGRITKYMEMNPKFKVCDQVWFLKPSGKIGRGLVSKISKVKMTQTTIGNGRKIDCVMFLYDINGYSPSLYEEDLFASEEELVEMINGGLIE